MTGTAETEAGEFEKIYKLEVVVIPTNRPIVRKDEEDLIFRTKREKFNAMIEQIQVEVKSGRAVLVGTASVEVSELLSKMLKRVGIPHNVLNAKHHAREADIIALAGRKGAITIATNMAGRGTDIKLDHDVKKNGGLAIIGSERHDARRIDRQLRGRENNFGIRKRLLEYDDVMNMQREVIYSRRKAALRGERLKGELFDYIEEIASAWYDQFHDDKQITELTNACRANLLCDPKIDSKEFEQMTSQQCVDRIVAAAEEFYSRKEDTLGSEFLAKIEQIAVLQTIDDKWREHLREMDDLKEGIHLRSYGQKDPLLEYKEDAFKLFENLINEINKESVTLAFKFFPRVVERRQAPGRDMNFDPNSDVPQFRRRNQSNTSYSYQHSSDAVPSFVYNGAPAQSQPETDGNAPIRTIRNTEKKVGRNDLCPCGSGKKYKSCHGKNIEFED